MASCTQLINRGGWAEDKKLNRCTFPIGPRNTYSNIAYVLGAVLLLLVVGSSAYAMSIALCVLGIGSFLYHGYKQVWANNLDWAGMYACFGVLLVTGWFYGAPGWLGLGIALFLIGALAFRADHYDKHMAVLFLCGFIPRYREVLAWAGLACFALAFIAWQLDRRGIGVWGHAVWHVLTASGMSLLYLSQAQG